MLIKTSRHQKLCEIHHYQFITYGYGYRLVAYMCTKGCVMRMCVYVCNNSWKMMHSFALLNVNVTLNEFPLNSGSVFNSISIFMHYFMYALRIYRIPNRTRIKFKRIKKKITENNALACQCMKSFNIQHHLPFIFNFSCYFSFYTEE